MNRNKLRGHALAYGMNKELVDLLVKNSCLRFSIDEAYRLHDLLVRPKRFTGNK